MSSSILRFFVVIAILAFAALLFFDATTYGISKANPSVGREKGCYTQLEGWFGVKRPTQWIRFAELTAAGVLALSGIAVMIAGRDSK